MVSNYMSVFNAYRRLGKSSQLIRKKKHLQSEFHSKNWIFTRFSWPRLLFVSSVTSNYIACKEALGVGIPCLGLSIQIVIRILCHFHYREMTQHYCGNFL